MSRRFILISVLLVSVMVWQALPAGAAGFPDKPINLIVGFGPGGMTDVCSRLFADKMEKFLGQKVIVENKPGAGGYKALKSVLDGPADGYTFVSCSTSTAAGTQLLHRPIAGEKIGLLGSFMPQERVLFSRKEAPFRTFDELIKYSKKTPVTFAGGGSIWAARVVEAMAKELKLKIRIVPFRSGSEGSAAILGGHVTMAETGVGTGAWQSALKGGLNVVAVLTDGDLKEFGFPEVKSIKDYGVTYFARMYFGFALPVGVPEERRQRLEDALKHAVEHPDVVKKMKELDLKPQFLSAKDYRPIINAVLKEAAELAAYLKK